MQALPIDTTGLLEQWIENDLAGRVNPYGLGILSDRINR
jgi:hypothetical protein